MNTSRATLLRRFRPPPTPRPYAPAWEDFPPDLPITARLQEIAEAIDRHQVVILAGETGSGKTTQIPKICLSLGYGVRRMIACTQPRRVAALSVSKRIAEELGVTWGREVGCKIRFTDKTSRETSVKMLTDGMLLSELQGDSRLSAYEVIILDEAHERSLNIDFLLGVLNRLRQHRPDLKIIITSATIDTATFSKAFDNAPIIEVSGRLYPVEVRYRPIDSLLEEEGEISLPDAVGAALEEILIENRPGDVLVFLPGERDIRETRELLEGRSSGKVDILPLFGRLTQEEQSRIFQTAGRRRKVILATNIAETSLTVPGIRYVIDSGLARVPRYSPHTRTQRLPIEPIAQSNAEQRKGRCGRVADGVCLRLYSEADLLSRPPFAQPEIQRSNLAAVILRMISLRLGAIEEFPFIEAPGERAVRAGFAQLHDLGALDDSGNLTPIGEQLARLPVDPTVGRMLLQAQQEGCAHDILVIASAMSIQDPRERPLDQTEKADQSHRRFSDPQSDFITLLKLWEAYHSALEKLSNRRLRTFCKEHYLNYQRMREWRDIHDQLARLLEETSPAPPRADNLPAPPVRRRRATLNRPPAAKEQPTFDPVRYAQIHRSLLSGLLGNIARRDAGNHYKATHSRNVMLFPGSALFDKKAAKAERAQHKGSQKPSNASGNQTPAWILCAEWVETSRLFARTCAAIEMPWILEFGAHLLKRSYSEPAWNPDKGRVLIKERTVLYGLEISLRRVGCAKIDPSTATDIFIRSALIDEDNESPLDLPFLINNRRLREKIENLQTRLRQTTAWHLDDRLYSFYAERLNAIGSFHDLRRFIRESHCGNDQFLHITESQLLPEQETPINLADFPDGVTFNGQSLPIAYAYRPGQETDGATLQIPAKLLNQFDSTLLDWAVPGYVGERVEALLRALPREIRRQLFPIQDCARALALKLRPDARPLTVQLSERLLADFGLRVWPRDWPAEAIPEHLRTRLEIIDEKTGQTVLAGRDWERIQQEYAERTEAAMREGQGTENLHLWQKACRRYEKDNLLDYTIGNLPLCLELGTIAGIPLHAFPALLRDNDGSIHLRLLKNEKEATLKSRPALRALAERQLGKDLGWLQKDLQRELKRLTLAAADWLPSETLAIGTWKLLLRHLLPFPQPLPLTREKFQHSLDQARRLIPGLPQHLADRLIPIFEKRRRLILCPTPYPDLARDLGRLLPDDFLTRLDFDQLAHLPRYLDACARRAERARLHPARDAEKAARIAPFAQAFRKARSLPDADPAQLAHIFWLLEEFRVQTFAQELGTATKVSPQRLQQELDKLTPKTAP